MIPIARREGFPERSTGLARSDDKLTITAGTVVKAVPGAVSCDLEDEAVVLHDGVYFTLNRLGAELWRLLQEARPFAEIRDWVLSEYEVEQGRCEADLRAWLEEMRGRGLVEVITTEATTGACSAGRGFPDPRAGHTPRTDVLAACERRGAASTQSGSGEAPQP